MDMIKKDAMHTTTKQETPKGEKELACLPPWFLTMTGSPSFLLLFGLLVLIFSPLLMIFGALYPLFKHWCTSHIR